MLERRNKMTDRREEPEREAENPPLVLRLLGPWEAQLEGGPMRPLRTRKGQWLLALLVLHPGMVEREWLAGLLWPNSAGAEALYNLRRSLTDLRGALGPEGRRLRTPAPRTLGLDLAGAEVDLLRFDAAIRQGDLVSLEAAVLLYRGALLLECTDEWVTPARTAREQEYLGALAALAGAASARANWEAAARYLRRSLAVDPLQETAQKALMAALAARGDEAAALVVYREYRLLLHRETSAAPGPEIAALFDQLRSQSRVRRRTSERERTGRRAPVPHEPTRHYPAPESVRSPPRPNSNLPHPVSSFVGREQEVQEVAARLAAARLVTLTGSGGVGKTRLAIQVAADRLPEYPDGVWFVDLAPLAQPALVPQIVVQVLGIGEETGRPLLETLAESIGPRRLLLILDNCEHLLDAAAQLAGRLLEGCPELRTLATSRQSLGLPGETVWRVPPLSVPGVQAFRRSGVHEAPDAAPESLSARMPERLIRYEAVRLFVERGVAAERAFSLTQQNAAAVAAVCQQLDGIPLAIELAAACLNALTAEQIAARLGDRFRLLTSGSRAALPRQQTLRAALDWSYDLLAAPERALFRRLSVFAGGFTLEAAEAVCGAMGCQLSAHGDDCGSTRSQRLTAGNPEVLPLLRGLVDQSLVIAEESRFRLLETLREYASDQLPEQERRALGSRHAHFFLDLTLGGCPHPFGDSETAWLDRIEQENDNLRAALDWAVAQGEVELALHLGAALGHFWNVRGYWREGRERLAAILALGAAHSHLAPDLQAAQARALIEAGLLAELQNEDTAARQPYEQALTIYRQLDDRAGIAQACMSLGSLARRRDDWATARALLTECLIINRDLDDPAGIAQALSGLGQVTEEEGDHSAARPLYQQGLSIWRERGNRLGMMFALQALGRMSYLDGEPETAEALFLESLSMARGLGNLQGVTFALYMLGSLARLKREYATAAAYHREGLDLYRELGDQASVAGSLAALAYALHFQGDHPRAAALFKEALMLNRKLGSRRRTALCLEGLAGVAASLPPVPGEQEGESLRRAARLFGAEARLREEGAYRWPADQADYQRNLGTLRRRLDRTALTAAWEEGAALPLNQAIELALSIG